MNRKLILLNLLTKRDGVQRAEFLRKNKVFYEMGEHCYWHPRTIPSEPYLLKIHNNVVVAAGASFHTHDVLEFMFGHIGGRQQYIGSIEICDNVFIGANSNIMYNVKIGPNAVVAAGSVVVKDVAPGTVVGGNPAKVIGNFDDLMKRRVSLPFPVKENREEVLHYFWGMDLTSKD